MPQPRIGLRRRRTALFAIAVDPGDRLPWTGCPASQTLTLCLSSLIHVSLCVTVASILSLPLA